MKKGRGIRQGGETSTGAFKAKDNPFMKRFKTHPVSLRIGAIPVGIPTVANDNCMLAVTLTRAQIQLLLAKDNALRVRYIFSASKSKFMCITDKASRTIPKMPFQFNNASIKLSTKEKHLGLVRTDDGKSAEAVRERIQVGWRTAYALMGSGLCGINGISPHLSKTLIFIYDNPAALY